MTITPGTRLGQYEVLGHIGSGGMGEVYRAKDTKLAREVALKVLPEAFARDPERLARFRREAQLLASLNHPNIAAVYSFEESDVARFLAMELVPGETLRERIQDGPLPAEEALKIAGQIAEALEHAHEKTVIHRDLKPANVKITPEGQVKVLDFGLAKAFSGDVADSDPHNAPTLSAATVPGTVLGTPAYMSPEQARGKKADKRSDIWALGAVLYELLTGKRAFPGETITEILAGVLKAEPDWNALPAGVAPNVRVLLRRCLHKDLQQRFKDAGDVRIEMAEALAAPVALPAALPPPAAPAGWRRAVEFGGIGLLVAAIAGLAVWNLKPAPAPRPVTRFVIALPAEQQWANLETPAMALSPDGKSIAYIAAGRSGIPQLYLRATDSLEAKPVSGSENVLFPFFSPDGQWLGFFVPGKLLKVSTSGGATVTVCGVIASPRGATWGPNDTILFTTTTGLGLYQVPAAGGTPQVLTNPDSKKGEVYHRWPEFLPGGKAVLFASGSGGNWDDAQIVGQRLDTGERQVLVQGGTFPHYVPTGHLVYYRAGTLMAVPFDLQKLEVKGAAAPVLEGVMPAATGTGAAQLSFSSTGSLLYIPGAAQGVERTLAWVDRKGAVQPLGAPLRAYVQPRLSPDGRQLAVTIEGATSDIWVYDFPRGTLTRLTFEGNNQSPLWTPDGKRIAFVSTKAGPLNLFWKPADGTGAEEQITKNENFFRSSSLSPDGKLAFFVEQNPTTRRDLSVVPLEGERKPAVFLKTPFDETVPQISPDGRWLAYLSNDSGRFEIYVRPFPGPGGKWQISTEGGQQPRWARNGRELFYRNGNKMMAVDITTQPSFAAGTPRVLFEGAFEARSGGGQGTNFDVAPDGQRFLMIRGGEEQAALTQMNVVMEWFEELKRKVPVK